MSDEQEIFYDLPAYKRQSEESARLMNEWYSSRSADPEPGKSGVHEVSRGTSRQRDRLGASVFRYREIEYLIVGALVVIIVLMIIQMAMET